MDVFRQIDEELGIIATGKNAVDAGYKLINAIHHKIVAGNYAVGHLKFLLNDGQSKQKISFTTITSTPPAYTYRGIETNRVVLLINARVQVSPVILQQIVTAAINETEISERCRIIEYNLPSFQPGYPRPTHRLSGR